MDYVEEKVEQVKRTETVRKNKKIVQDVQMKVVSAPKKSVKINPTQSLNETVIIRRRPKVILDAIDNEPLVVEDVIKPTIKAKKTTSKERPVDVNTLIAEHKKENNRVKNFKMPALKSNGGNIIDNYLDDENTTSNPYAKIIAPKKKEKKKEQVFEFSFPEPNETGYDYRDAVHPTEELDEIMLRRLKQDVIDLPEKTRINEYVEITF